MALIVETGVGLANSESYASVAELKTYWDNFGLSYAAFSDTQLEQHLRKGTRYMVQKYRLRWKGVRTSSTQALDWPRSGVATEPGALGYGGLYVVDPNTVPTDIKNACIIMANKSSAGVDLFADGTQKAVEETIGPITVKYEQGSSQRVQYDSVSALLAPYLSSVGGVSVSLVKG